MRGKKENSTDSPGMSTSFPGLPAAEPERTGQLPLSTGWGPQFAGAGRPLCSAVWDVLMWQPVFPKVSSGSHSQNSRTICTIFFSSLNLNQDKLDSKMLTLKKKLEGIFFLTFECSLKILDPLFKLFKKSKFRSVHPLLQNRIIKKTKGN